MSKDESTRRPPEDPPLLAEIRAVRRQIAEETGSDVERLYRELLKVQEREKHRTVSTPADSTDRASKAG